MRVEVGAYEVMGAPLGATTAPAMPWTEYPPGNLLTAGELGYATPLGQAALLTPAPAPTASPATWCASLYRGEGLSRGLMPEQCVNMGYPARIRPDAVPGFGTLPGVSAVERRFMASDLGIRGFVSGVPGPESTPADYQNSASLGGVLGVSIGALQLLTWLADRIHVTERDGVVSASEVINTAAGPIAIQLDEPRDLADRPGSVADVLGDVGTPGVRVAGAPTPLVDWWDQGVLNVVPDSRPDFMMGCWDVRASDRAALSPAALDRKKRQARACQGPRAEAAIASPLLALAVEPWATDTTYGFIVVGDGVPDTLMEPYMVRKSDWGVLASGEPDPERRSIFGHKVYDTTKWTNRNTRQALERWATREEAETARWRAADVAPSAGLLGAKAQQAIKAQLDLPERPSLGAGLAARAAAIMKAVLTDPFFWVSLVGSAAWFHYLPWGAWIPVVTYGVVRLYWGLVELAVGK